MDPLVTYDYLTNARTRLFEWARPLAPAQYRQPFPVGSIAAGLTHIMISEWYYIQRMTDGHVPPYDQWPIRDENPPTFDELEAAWTKQAPETRAALAAVDDWNAPISYRVTNEHGIDEIVTTSARGLFTQLVLHEVHHRALILHMLRALGAPVDDVDFNALTFHRAPA